MLDIVQTSLIDPAGSSELEECSRKSKRFSQIIETIWETLFQQNQTTISSSEHELFAGNIERETAVVIKVGN